MNDQVSNLILEKLKRMDVKLDDLRQDIRDPKDRVSNVERQCADLHVQYATVSSRIDRIESRLDRIERRLDLVEV
jgi:predicted  nucleic acid-binding Zn-ribbon protein